MDNNLKEIKENLIKDIEKNLIKWTYKIDTPPSIIHKAIQYSLTAGGKRLRPLLLLFAFDMCEKKQYDPFPACVALECIHTYSLIHDDLPCMDNSDLRRGRATCHKVYGDAFALLAGDALLTHSFELLSTAYDKTPKLAVELIKILSNASNSQKLIGGQVEDIIGETGEINIDRLMFIYKNKTAALITAAIKMGFILGNADEKTLQIAEKIGENIGIAFQIIDDILDLTSEEKTIGKPVQADASNKKLTYPALFGLKKANEKARELTNEAIKLCESISKTKSNLLPLLIKEMSNRTF